MLFLDTSALLKRYIEEAGTPLVLELMERDPAWAASALAEAEAAITICQLGLDETDEAAQLRRLRVDWERFTVVPVDGRCLARAAEIGCEARIRTLDAIHLAAAGRLPGPVAVVTFDERQAAAARAIGLRMAGEAD